MEGDSPESPLIWKARDEDWLIVARLVEALWTHEAGLDPRIAADPAPNTSAVFDACQLIREGCAILGAVGDQAVGLLGLKQGAYHGKHTCARAPFYYVHPDYRDGHLARRMWEKALEAIGDQPLQIWVSEENRKYARVMSRWFGFKPAATIYERSPS